MPLQLRRGTQNELNNITPAEGELIYVRPTSPVTIPKIFVGDGSTQGGLLVTGLNENDAKEAAGQSLENGSHVGIRFEYDSGTQTVNATVDLSEATFNTINGSIVGDDSTTLVNAETGVITASSITVGTSATITAVGSTINLPAGSTVDGDIIGIKLGSDDSTIVTIPNGTTIPFLGGEGIETSIDAGAVKITATGRKLTPTGQSGETNIHYVPFLGSFELSSTVLADGNFRYTPSTEILEVGGILTSTLGSPTINTTNITTADVGSNGALLLYSNVTSGNNVRLVTVGSDSVDGRFQVVTSGIFPSGLPMARFVQSHSTQDASNVQFNRSRGTAASPTAIQTGDDIADLAFGGYDGSAYTVRAAITASIDGAVSTGVVPTKLEIFTGSTSADLAVSINSSKQTSFNGAITLATYADATARDIAIPSPTAGMMIYISGTGKFQGYNGLTTSWNDLN